MLLALSALPDTPNNCNKWNAEYAQSCKRLRRVMDAPAHVTTAHAIKGIKVCKSMFVAITQAHSRTISYYLKSVYESDGS